MTPNNTFLRVAAASPAIHIANPAANRLEIVKLYQKALKARLDLVLFPELTTTGYSAGDLFFQSAMLKTSTTVLFELAKETEQGPVLVVGAPIEFQGKLYNCAVVMAGGRVVGIVPKSYLPNYNEYYEMRWFRSGLNIKQEEVVINGQRIAFGVDLLFDVGGVTVSVEICEDLWAPNPPSVAAALMGAEVILNLSASNELVGKSEYRRQLVVQHSARLIAGYLYAAASSDESTADTVYSGHLLSAQNGRLVAEDRWHPGALQISDIDIDQIRHDRRQNSSFYSESNSYRTVSTDQLLAVKRRLIDRPTQTPFIPTSAEAQDLVSREILDIQAHGLATQMSAAGIEKIVLGLSGGLDSTLALIAATRAMKVLGLPAKNIWTITMPAKASSTKTQNNADKLAAALHTTHERIDIQEMVDSQLESIGHDQNTQDITYENTQARVRTSLVMNKANQIHGLILGTGDLSEIALGWSTFNGDHMSGYHVNASIPKGLVRYIVDWAARQPELKAASKTLRNIIDTPISPELTDNDGLQKTEQIVGPYELHDFFLYHFKRWGASKEKIAWLAEQAFGGSYSKKEIVDWLDRFFIRFTANQFKRESMPNGPKVGTVSLSPRSDWRMSPSVSRNWHQQHVIS